MNGVSIRYGGSLLEGDFRFAYLFRHFEGPRECKTDDQKTKQEEATHGDLMQPHVSRSIKSAISANDVYASAMTSGCGEQLFPLRDVRVLRHLARRTATLTREKARVTTGVF